MSAAIGYAHWYSHVNGVNPPHWLRHWLTDRVSLTRKLVASASRFRVQPLRQDIAPALADEYLAAGLPRRCRVQTREVLLRCDEQPVVFAHTIVPLTATASDWPFFGALGQRSLGTTLFGDPRVRRGALQFARLHARHPLARHACAALGAAQMRYPLYARRCLFRRKNGLLLVTEVFLPALADLAGARREKNIQGLARL